SSLRALITQPSVTQLGRLNTSSIFPVKISYGRLCSSPTTAIHFSFSLLKRTILASIFVGRFGANVSEKTSSLVAGFLSFDFFLSSEATRIPLREPSRYTVIPFRPCFQDSI